jgi:hypothetical protein
MAKVKLPNLYKILKSNNTDMLEKFFMHNMNYDFKTRLTIGKNLTIYRQTIENKNTKMFEALLNNTPPKALYCEVSVIVSEKKNDVFYDLMMKKIEEILYHNDIDVFNPNETSHNIFYEILINSMKYNFNIERISKLLDSPYFNLRDNLIDSKFKVMFDENIAKSSSNVIKYFIRYYKDNNFTIDQILAFSLLCGNKTQYIMGLIKKQDLDVLVHIDTTSKNQYSMASIVLFTGSIIDMNKIKVVNKEMIRDELEQLLKNNTIYNINEYFSITKTSIYIKSFDYLERIKEYINKDIQLLMRQLINKCYYSERSKNEMLTNMDRIFGKLTEQETNINNIFNDDDDEEDEYDL